MLDRAGIRTRLAVILASLMVATILLYELVPQVAAGMVLIGLLCLYGTVLTIGVLHHKRRQRQQTSQLIAPGQAYEGPWPRVSMLVPAHDEADVIGDTIAGLLAQDYPDVELIVVNDRSRDDTWQAMQVAAERAGHPPQLQLINRPLEAIPGKSAVLNEALALSTGEIIAVFDADASCEPDFLRQSVPLFADGGDIADSRIGAVQAQKRISNRELNRLTRCQHYEYNLDAYFQSGRDAVRSAVELRGNGQLVRRKAVVRVGGWNEESLTDDLDLSTRLQLDGWDIRFARQASVYEQAVCDIDALIRQRKRWAEGSLIRYLTYAPAILKPSRGAFRAKIDMVAYLVEFLFPFWLLTDYGLITLHYWLGDVPRSHLVSSLLVLPVLGAFFVYSLIIAIYRFNRPIPWRRVVKGALITAMYMPLVWIPVVFWVTLKLLVRRQRGFVWHKTHHAPAPIAPV